MDGEPLKDTTDLILTASRRADELTREGRQAILDDLRTGMTVGEVANKHNIDSWLTFAVIQKNMRVAHYIDWVAE